MRATQENSPRTADTAGGATTEECTSMATRDYIALAEGLQRIDYTGPRGTTVTYKSTIYADGGSSSQTLPFTSDREAKKWHASRQVKKEEGTLVLDSKTTFAAHCQTHLENLKSLVAAGERKATTYANREKAIRNHLAPAFGRRKLRDLTPAHIRTFITEKRAAGLDVGTLCNHLSAVLTDAVERDLLPFNPYSKVGRGKKPSRTPKTEARVLAAADIRLLISKARPGAKDVLSFIAYTGCRLSEALGLVWSNVDLDAGTVSFDLQLAPLRKGEQPQRAALKTKNSRRTITLHPDAVEMLKARRRAAFQQGNASAESFVFAAESGRPIDQRNVAADIRNAGNRAGLNDEGKAPVSCHDLRHTFATNVHAQTRDPLAVARLIGDDVLTVMKIYVHPTDTQNDEQVWAAVSF
jgi:integrase